jgi:hypothetical protein
VCPHVLLPVARTRWLRILLVPCVEPEHPPVSFAYQLAASPLTSDLVVLGTLRQPRLSALLSCTSLIPIIVPTSPRWTRRRFIKAHVFLHSALNVRVRDSVDHLIAFLIVLKMPKHLPRTPSAHPHRHKSPRPLTSCKHRNSVPAREAQVTSILSVDRLYRAPASRLQIKLRTSTI